MEKDIKLKIIINLIWKFLERIGTQGIQFIIQIFLARILLPKDYGIIAIITVFLSLANVFVQSGFNTALIQKKDVDGEDFSSVFYLSLVTAFFFYLLLYIISPKIEQFYKLDELSKIIRILSLTLFLGALNAVQSAYISRKMMFKKLFFSSLGAIIISGILGLIFAYKGYGVWTLVYQQLINQTIVVLILWYTVSWRPQFLFSWKKVKKLFCFGWKLLLSSLLDTGYREMTNLVIGKIYTPTTLGYYNRGNQFPNLIVSNYNGAIQSVIFPVLSSIQEDKIKVKEVMRKSIIISSYIIFPMMIGLLVIAEPLIEILLTEKWLPCVPYLRIFCLSYALWPIHTANLQAINAVGRSDIFLKLEIIKKLLGIVIIVISVKYNPLVMTIGILISSIISSFINAAPNKKLLGYSYLEQLRDIGSSILLSITMGMIIYPIIFFRFSNILTIFFQIIIGITVYIFLSYMFNVRAFNIFISTFLKLKRKNYM